MTIKKCPDCGEEKPRSEFYGRGVKENHIPASKCKKCFNQYCVKRWCAKRLQAIEYLGGVCVDCDGTFHPNVYDFHHLYDKDMKWSKLRLRPWARVETELNKCVLLCANCHRLRHIEDSSPPQVATR